MNDNDQFLFDMEEPKEDAFAPSPITNNQITQIRQAFEAAGIESQDSRKTLIESCTFREVASIRELHSHEVRRIITRIQASGAAKGVVTGSAWDNREEDTWIDKL